MLVGLGDAESIAITGIRVECRHRDGRSTTKYSDDAWAELIVFIDAHDGEYILGYIGFDINYVGDRDIACAGYPVAMLMTAQCLIDISYGAVQVSGNESLARDAFAGPECACRDLEPIDGLQLDRLAGRSYRQAV